MGVRRGLIARVTGMAGGAILAAALEPLTATQSRPAVAPGPSRVVLTTDKASYFLGENVLIHFCFEATSAQPVTIDSGGDYRGGTRSQRFQMTVVDRQGQPVPDPDPGGANEGGLGGQHTVAPGERWCQSLPLMRYARIDAPGTYDIRVTHDLGWPPGQAPSGSISISFIMPSAAEAEQVLADAAMRPEEPLIVDQLRRPYLDYTTFRYDVYRVPLARWARAGNPDALKGLGTIPTPEATRALVDLLASDSPPLARAAAQQLALRLPDPQLTGDLPRRSPFGNDLASSRAYLINKSWRQEFAGDVRTAAAKLLASADVQDVVEGAFFLEAVGELSDAPRLSAALTRAAENTLTLPFETRGYPRPRGAAAELMRAANILIARGYVPTRRPTTPGDLVLWLIALGRATPTEDWEPTVAQALVHPIPYVREVALDNMPAAVPPTLIPEIGTNLLASNLDVQIAACRLVQRAKLQILRAPVTAIAERAKEFWLRNASENALYALGGPIDVLEIRARRLVEPDMSTDMLRSLADSVFEPSGSSSRDIPVDQLAALSERWLKFITEHRRELEAGQRLSLDRTDIPTDLMPPGWTLFRSGKPAWPPR